MRTFVPRLVALTVVWLLATAALTYAAAQKIATPTRRLRPPRPPRPRRALLTVPDVRRQAYTFAKGTLSDAGFAWKVTGSVRGFASNTVALQTPAPGTQVIDTGAPTIVLPPRAQRRAARDPRERLEPSRDADPARRARLQRGQGSRHAAIARRRQAGQPKRAVKKAAAPVAKAKPKVVAKKQPSASSPSARPRSSSRAPAASRSPSRR